MLDDNVKHDVFDFHSHSANTTMYFKYFSCYMQNINSFDVSSFPEHENMNSRQKYSSKNTFINMIEAALKYNYACSGVDRFFYYTIIL